MVGEPMLARAGGWRATDLELLTALRRLTGDPDPLRVCIENEAPLETVPCDRLSQEVPLCAKVECHIPLTSST